MYNDSFRKRYGNAPVAISCTDNYLPTMPHIHNEIEILSVVRGTSEIQISNQTYAAKAGDLFFVNPLEVHAITADENQPYEHRCICFDLSLIADRRVTEALGNGYLAIPHVFAETTNHTAALRSYFDELYHVVFRNSPALLFEANALISRMFSLFIRHDLLEIHATEDKQARFCGEVIQYISANYGEEITSREAAQSMFYTQYHFCRKFKQHFGVSFSAYLHLYRLLTAKELLQNGSERIIDVAQKCGFGDAVYFTKSFKKVFGITPLKWQKSQSRTKI